MFGQVEEGGRGAAEAAQAGIDRPELDEVIGVLESGWLPAGARVREFERQVAAFVHSADTATVDRSHAALGLAVRAAASAERDADEPLSLPFSPSMTDEEVARIVVAIQALIGGQGA